MAGDVYMGADADRVRRELARCAGEVAGMESRVRSIARQAVEVVRDLGEVFLVAKGWCDASKRTPGIETVGWQRWLRDNEIPYSREYTYRCMDVARYWRELDEQRAWLELEWSEVSVEDAIRMAQRAKAGRELGGPRPQERTPRKREVAAGVGFDEGGAVPVEVGLLDDEEDEAYAVEAESAVLREAMRGVFEFVLAAEEPGMLLLSSQGMHAAWVRFVAMSSVVYGEQLPGVEDERATVRQLAKAMGLSPEAVSKQRRRLKERLGGAAGPSSEVAAPVA